MDPAAPAASEPSTTTVAVYPDRSPTYFRRLWRHWIDADGDCQDTREEVLIAQARGRVTYKTSTGCKVASGSWVCPFTGKTITNPANLDVSHMVPLFNAYRSGAGPWASERKKEYANYLGDRDHLIAVDASANRSKGDKGPEDWLPPNASYRCEYVKEWVRIKRKWKLTAAEREQQAIDQALQTCKRGEVPALPQGGPGASPGPGAPESQAPVSTL